MSAAAVVPLVPRDDVPLYFQRTGRRPGRDTFWRVGPFIVHESADGTGWVLGQGSLDDLEGFMDAYGRSRPRRWPQAGRQGWTEDRVLLVIRESIGSLGRFSR